MYFYKLTRNGKTVFATMSESPIPNPDYQEATREEYEGFAGIRLPNPVEAARGAKLAELSAACSAAITAGCDVALGDGSAGHIALTAEDQINLSTAVQAVDQGAEGYPYHLDGQLCRMYPAEEFAALAQAATAHVFYHRTYCNHLNAWIRRAGLEELAGIAYGAALPEDLAASMQTILDAAGGW